MSTEHRILCGTTVDDSLPFADKTLSLRMWGPLKNVTLESDSIQARLTHELTEELLDLIEVATYVYCADQAITRGGSDVETIAANWRRPLSFKIPVRCLDLWKSSEVIETLNSTLGFLSDDEFSFEFEPLHKPPGKQTYLQFAKEDLPIANVEEVVLYSGGLDSLGGAIQEAIVDKRLIALVTHKSTPKLDTRRRRMNTELAARSPRPPIFFPVQIHKNGNLNREYTQRTRSFLYAAIAAAVAYMAGLSRIRFYENGVVSINLPLAEQVVGSKATRTTHPRVLNGFAKLFSQITGRKFVVENPFLWYTKADVIRLIDANCCGGLISHATSCTHTWEMTNQHSHCGTCSQCIDRRFSVMAAGAQSHDPADAYRVDLLTGERDVGEDRDILAAYVETATNISRMSAVDFFTRYGEAARIVKQLPDPPDAAALKIFELYKRHSIDVIKVIDDAIAVNSAAIRERILPEHCLLRMVLGTSRGDPRGQPITARSEPELADNVFAKRGQAWTVRYAGGEPFMMLPSKGMGYLQQLLSHPHNPIPATELAVSLVRPSTQQSGDAAMVIDAEAEMAYRARVADLYEELEQAKGDAIKIEAIKEELTWFEVQMRKGRGFAGRPRRFTSDRDRVRKAVLAAIRRTKRELAKYDKRLAAHLNNPVLRCGYEPCYAPPEPVEWQTGP